MSFGVFDHRDPLGRARMSPLQLDQLVSIGGELLLPLGQSRFGLGNCFLAPVGLLDKLFQPVPQVVQLGRGGVDLAFQLGQTLLGPLASRRGGLHLALQSAAFVPQRGGRAHLIHVGRATLLVLAADMIQLAHHAGQFALALDQMKADLPMLLFRLLHGLTRIFKLLPKIAGPRVHGHQLPSLPGDFLFQIATATTFMFDRRFVRRDAFPIGRNPTFRLTNGLGDVTDPVFCFKQLGFGGFHLGRGPVALIGKRGEFRLEFGQLLAQPSPIGQPHLGAQLLESVGVLLVTPSFSGLHPHATQPTVHLVDNVGKPQEVLVDPLQTPQGLDLLGLEPTDPGRFLENQSPVSRRGLQEDVDLPLLDHAVGVGPHAGAGEHVANVAQPGRIAVDQILALAAAKDTAGEVDLGRVDGE